MSTTKGAVSIWIDEQTIANEANVGQASWIQCSRSLFFELFQSGLLSVSTYGFGPEDKFNAISTLNTLDHILDDVVI